MILETNLTRLPNPELIGKLNGLAETRNADVLAVTWQHPFTRKISAIGLLSQDSHGIYRFNYVRNVLNIEDFVPLVGFQDLYSEYKADQLFPLFAQRVMDPRRPDYKRFVTALGLADNPTPWEQLAHSGGRRTGDTLQLLPFPEPFKHSSNTWGVSFLVPGTRHIAGKTRHLHDRTICVTSEEMENALTGLQPGSELQLIPEPSNPENPQAIIVADAKGLPIGYMPDLFTEEVAQLNLHNITCVAQIVDGPEAPWHMRIVARLECTVPSDFRFFSSDSWHILSSPTVSS